MQILRVGDKVCALCVHMYPGWAVEPLIFDQGPLPVCPICAEVVFGGDHKLPDWYRERVLYRFRHWLTTEGGRWYVIHNSFLSSRIDIIDNPDYPEREVRMRLHPVRVCYVAVFQPAKKPNTDPPEYQYGLVVMVPKNRPDLVRQINEAQKAAIEAGIAKGKFPRAASKSPAFKLIIRDGDAEVAAGTRGPEFAGHYFFSANRAQNKGKPNVFDRQLQPIMSEDEFYSGVIAAVDINFFPYNSGGSKGIAVGLNQVMKWEDAPRLDGRLSPEQAFGDLVDVPEDDPVAGAASDEEDIPF